MELFCRYVCLKSDKHMTYDNDLRLIIDICFYETFSTPL
jgi:hypothetical protein